MSPFLISSNLVQIPTYWIVISLVYCVTFIFLYRRSIKKNLSVKICAELALIIMFSGFIGARLFHVLFEYPDYYSEYPIEILKFWNGGFVFYGGFIFSMLSGIFYLRKYKQNVARWLDTLAPVICLGYALGRLGCLMAGCCYGTACDFPWAITFSQGVEAPPFIRLHPTQVYAALIETFILGILLLIERKRTDLPKGNLFSIWLILHGIGRLFLEQYRGDFRGNSLLGFSISSIVSVIIIGAGIMFLTRMKKSTDH